MTTRTPAANTAEDPNGLAAAPGPRGGEPDLRHEPRVLRAAEPRIELVAAGDPVSSFKRVGGFYPRLDWAVLAAELSGFDVAIPPAGPLGFWMCRLGGAAQPR